MAETYDLAIIGGGINGAGIARDAAGRGAKVALFERGDLASATSSASTKLIHGGLRYLEHAEFRLVAEALAERSVLLGIAPHLIRPMRFVLPIEPGLRPRWLLRLGLFLYDRLGGRGLPASRSLDLLRDPAGGPLKPHLRWAFEYSDCWVDDARLVVLNALDAAERGASVRTRTAIVSAQREGALWRLATDGGDIHFARGLVNAAGPWVEQTQAMTGAATAHHVRLVQGSHIVVNRLFDGERAYIFQNRDKRVVFAIPYLNAFTLIGTTDVEVQTAESPNTTQAEIAYLCEAASTYFKRSIQPTDVVWTYAGVRPLIQDGAGRPEDASRDYALALDAPADCAPLLSVYGGKITTYRRLAEAALRLLSPKLNVLAKPEWTAGAALPGGDFPPERVESMIVALRGRFPFLAPGHAERLSRAYGARAPLVLGTCAAARDLGTVFTGDLTAREVEYLIRKEWARTAEDVLWRRTKLGARAGAAQIAELEEFMRNQRHLAPPLGA